MSEEDQFKQLFVASGAKDDEAESVVLADIQEAQDVKKRANEAIDDNTKKPFDMATNGSAHGELKEGLWLPALPLTGVHLAASQQHIQVAQEPERQGYARQRVVRPRRQKPRARNQRSG